MGVCATSEITSITHVINEIRSHDYLPMEEEVKQSEFADQIDALRKGSPSWMNTIMKKPEGTKDELD